MWYQRRDIGFIKLFVFDSSDLLAGYYAFISIANFPTVALGKREPLRLPDRPYFFPKENRNDSKHNNLLVLSLYCIIVIVNLGYCGGRRRKTESTVPPPTKINLRTCTIQYDPLNVLDPKFFL